MLYKIGWCACMALIRILFGVRVTGRENIPKDQGYILVANHRSNFDPLFVAVGIHKQVHYMAKAELFRNKLLGCLLKGLGAFPVERGKGDSGAIEWAEELIREGRVLGLFPEGPRSKDGKLQRPRSGAALIAMQTGADVLPCAVCYGDRLGFRTKVNTCYGELIKNERFGFTPGVNSPRELKDASHLIMDEIVKLMEGIV